MLYYSVIGLCIFLLLAVIYFSVKPISMGIEARRNIKDSSDEEKKIESALKSVNFAHEIVVILDRSKDKTESICKKYTKKIFKGRREVKKTHESRAIQRVFKKIEYNPIKIFCKKLSN